MSFVRSFLLAVAAVLVVGSGTGYAAPASLNQTLKGDYAFSGSATCLVSRGGFVGLNPAPTPAPFPFIVSFSVQGVRTFNGDGTGSVAARVVALSHPFTLPANPPTVPAPVFNRGRANVSDVEAEFTYEVAPDLTVTVENVAFLGTSVSNPGQTFTIANFPTFVGRIAKDHKTLTLAHEDAVVETQTFFTGNVQTDVQQRICHRARILLEQKGGN